jgi:hypothetical protein
MDINIDLKIFRIYLPNGDSKSFMLYHDFKELFGDEVQNNAVKKIKREIALLDIKKAPNIYYGDNHIGIRTGSAEIIFQIVKIIDNLSLPNFKLGFSNDDWSNLHNRLLLWKTPKRQKWKEGDIFAIELLDKTYAFGQVLSDTPTVALFDYKTEVKSISFKELETKRVLTIIHTTPNDLNNWNWEVLGNHKILVDKDIGPYGPYSIRAGLTSYTSGVLKSVCNYYWFKKSNWANPKEIEELIMK